MKGVDTLQDLKKKLLDFGTEVLDSQGWFLVTPHGVWGMSFGVVYLNNFPIVTLDQAEELAQYRPEPQPEITETAKKRSRKKISSSRNRNSN